MTTELQNVLQNPDLIKDHLRIMSRGINSAIGFANRNFIEWSITETSTDITLGDNDTVVLVDASSGNVVVNLPEVSSVNERLYTIKKTDISANTVTLTPSSTSATVDGAINKVISSQYVAHTIVSNSSNWWIL